MQRHALQQFQLGQKSYCLLGVAGPQGDLGRGLHDPPQALQ
jgi:hypothetical protein